MRRELTRDERRAIRRLVTSLCANYDRTEGLCLPLDCPCYMLNKWWTGGLPGSLSENPGQGRAASAVTLRQRCCR